MLLLNKNKECQTGYQAQACFQIGLHSKDRALLEMFRASLGGVGNIAKQGKDSIQYRVTSPFFFSEREKKIKKKIFFRCSNNWPF
jgi:hypothetical protein